ncbi:hypothetical protein TRFO_16612 [Tritrichomonas foetus]|uniref:Peptidase M60 domain-containing protein n=1 Tax=Tritrichomonas foetus TaxID=1144522 RepID=A0A1J4KQT1_9EUKA|nr:hypothetical protein TRFO_16612 [Tritrichomonas foetus]|eukprot:OHT13288.1 hypothetical protein TRFO_16612 [Tritrichomonas foetus]
MGCGNTKVAPTPHKMRGLTTTTFTETETNNNEAFTFQEIAESYEFLVNNCSAVKCPPGSVPVVCLSEDSIPVVMASLLIEKNIHTGIFMPFIAAAMKKTGRIICFGHINLLNRTFFNSSDTALIINNALLWLNGKKALTNPIYFLGFPNSYHNELKACFQPHGMRIHFESEINETSLKEQTYILIPSFFDIKNRTNLKHLKEFFKKGGGIGIFYVPQQGTSPQDAPMNRFLMKFGLSFTFCSFSDEFGSSMTVTVHDSYDAAKKYTFDNLVYQFDAMINAENRNNNFIDEIITTLRYYVIVSGRKQIHLINHLVNLCWDFLEKTNYKSEDGKICPTVLHSIIVVLMQELFAKQPVDRIKAAADATIFPGIPSNAEPTTLTMEIELLEESLISTGLWLLPGMIAEIDIDINDLPINLQLQVGAHTLSLLNKPGPWKRWPMPCSAFDILRPKTLFSSHFGGIIYLAVGKLHHPEIDHENDNQIHHEISHETNHEINHELGMKRIIKLTFDKVCFYPLVSYLDKSTYEKTRKFDTQWGELVSKSIIFTLPTKYLQQIDDFDKTFAHIESFMTELVQYMEYELVRPYRIVFDVELIDDQPVPRYPIMLLESDINDILFVHDKPTPGLFRALMMLAMVSLRDDCFEINTEKALSAFVAAQIFKKKFSFFDPLDKPLVDYPILFKELWLIHMQINDKIIPEIIHKSQKPDCLTFEVPQDRWIQFVRDLCDSAKFNFASILDKARPIPLNVASVLESLKNPPPLEY